MELPFTAAEFFSVFERYNIAILPAQLVAYAAAIFAVVMRFAHPGRRTAEVVIGAVLAAFWAFTGLGYFIVFFRELSAIAVPAGLLFILQSMLFLAATSRRQLRFARNPGPAAWMGLALAAYAMFAYPYLGAAAGHTFPRSPAFGVTPCPTTIFTWGMLLLTTGSVPRWLLIVPVAWSLVGTSAALQLGVVEDFGLAVAAFIGTLALLVRHGSDTHVRHHAAA